MEVDLPAPVAPMNIMMPRLLMHTSLSTGGRFSSSNVGMITLMVRIAMPTRPCCTNALQRKRPMPGGAMAKLHSLVDSNSIACLSFITLRTSSMVCWDVSAVFDTGAILPSILSAGGKPAVMNRSEPFCLTSKSRSSWMNLVAVSRSMRRLPGRVRLPAEQVLVDSACPRLGQLNLVAPDQFGQALIHRLHACRLAGLDNRVHLRYLVLPNQVTDRRRAHHDLPRGHAALPVLGLEQRLRDYRDQRFRQHRPDHVLFRGREHVDDAVDGFCCGAGVQGGEDQVPRFGRRQRQPDSLQVTHFADQDVIGVFAQRRAQRV